MTTSDLVLARAVEALGSPLELGAVLVDHAERTVIRARGPQGHDVVVKVDRDAARLARERAATAAAAAGGVPVPTLRATLAGHPPGVVTDFVAGEELGSSSPPAAWAAVGAALRCLHDRSPTAGIAPFGGGDGAGTVPGRPPGWWAFLRWWLEYEVGLVTGDPDLDPRVLAWTESAVQRCADDGANRPEPRRLLHGDCGPYHWLLLGGEVVAALDLADAGLGDPAWDVVVLTSWAEERLPDVLHGYGADVATVGHLRTVYRPYQLLREVASLRWLREHDVDPTPLVGKLNRMIEGVARKLDY